MTRSDRSTRLLQANLNHCSGAQDLLIQTLADRRIGLAIVSEPYLVPKRDNWFGSRDGRVAIAVAASASSAPAVFRLAGDGFVVVAWSGLMVAGVYASPNVSLSSFEALLGRLGVCVRDQPAGPVVIGGDFNAKSPLWGSPRANARGETLSSWAASLDLRVMNRGTALTCVRGTGGSIVDVTFANSAAARHVSGWRVLEDVETLSDHLYVQMKFSANPLPETGARPPRRWAL